jgi:probable addiction module antidote protein
MAPVARDYKEHLFEGLQDPDEVEGYLTAALEEGDAAALLLALRDIAEARGVSKVAADANLNREHVYRILSGDGNPRLSSLLPLLGALGIGLQAKVAKQSGAGTVIMDAPAVSGTRQERDSI